MPVTSASMTVASLTVLSPAAGVRWRDRTPYLGTLGQLRTEPELKVEVACPTGRVETVLAAVKRVHPYEEPVINVIPLYRTGL